MNLALSSRNRSASCRIPMYSPSPKAKRVEVRFPDPACNPYLAFAAMLMAGLDGIENRIDPGQPLDKDIYALSPEELKDVPTMPGCLDEALDELEEDHEFLLKGDVFTEDVIATWIEYKRKDEVDAGAPAAASARVRAVLRRVIATRDFESRTHDQNTDPVGDLRRGPLYFGHRISQIVSRGRRFPHESDASAGRHAVACSAHRERRGTWSGEAGQSGR